jgi:hypothetical protein
MLKAFSIKLFACMALVFTLSVQAEQTQTFGKYEVHYNAFNSSFLQPKVAASYDIQRSKYRSLVNITVLRKEPDGTLKPVQAFIKGNVRNLIQQSNELNFRPIIEQDAIYHIADFKVASQDTFTFTLDIQPDPNKPAFTLSFRQTLYPN